MLKVRAEFTAKRDLRVHGAVGKNRIDHVCSNISSVLKPRFLKGYKRDVDTNKLAPLLSFTLALELLYTRANNEPSELS